MLEINAAMTTSGIADMICPITSPIKNIGANAAMVVRMLAVTGPLMRVTPFSAAVTGDSPASSRATICSPTTMASSTMIPIVIISANSETILMLCPLQYMMAKVANNVIGIPSATQKVARRSRNKNSTSSTSISPPMPFSTSNCMRPIKKSEDVSYFSTRKEGGNSAKMSSRAALT